MVLDAEIGKARTLVEALPYIKKFAGQTLVIKFGASLLGREELRDQFIQDLLLLKYVGMNPILVHGGGDEITKWAGRLGKKTEFRAGVRVSDSETVEIAEMVLTGRLTSSFVSAIQRQGGKAAGVSGKDANLFTACPAAAVRAGESGYAGEIESVDCALLKTLLAGGYIPVVSSIGLSRRGESYLLSSDQAAASMAAAMKAFKLIFLTNVKGIMAGEKLLSLLDLHEAQELAAGTEVTGGMLAKLRESIRAIKGGVTNVHIISGLLEHALLLEVLTDLGIGTMISNERMRI